MTGALDYLKWPSLARDLAVMTVPDSPLEDLDKVLTTYNLSREELAKLLRVDLAYQPVQHVCKRRADVGEFDLGI